MQAELNNDEITMGAFRGDIPAALEQVRKDAEKMHNYLVAHQIARAFEFNFILMPDNFATIDALGWQAMWRMHGRAVGKTFSHRDMTNEHYVSMWLLTRMNVPGRPVPEYIRTSDRPQAFAGQSGAFEWPPRGR